MNDQIAFFLSAVLIALFGMGLGAMLMVDSIKADCDRSGQVMFAHHAYTCTQVKSEQ